jgi:hypothetical protein
MCKTVKELCRNVCTLIHTSLTVVWCWCHPGGEPKTFRMRNYLQLVSEFSGNVGNSPLWIAVSVTVETIHMLSVRSGLDKQLTFTLFCAIWKNICPVTGVSLKSDYSPHSGNQHLPQNMLGLPKTSTIYPHSSSQGELCTHSNMAAYSCLKSIHHFGKLEVCPLSWWRPPLYPYCYTAMWGPMKIIYQILMWAPNRK